MTAGGDELFQEIGKHATAAIQTGMPSQLSWGFCSGYCAGFAAKKASKVVAVGLGSLWHERVGRRIVVPGPPNRQALAVARRLDFVGLKG